MSKLVSTSALQLSPSCQVRPRNPSLSLIFQPLRFCLPPTVLCPPVSACQHLERSRGLAVHFCFLNLCFCLFEPERLVVIRLGRFAPGLGNRVGRLAGLGGGRRTKGFGRRRRDTSLIEQPKWQHDEQENDRGRQQSQEAAASLLIAGDRYLFGVMVLRVRQASPCFSTSVLRCFGRTVLSSRKTRAG